MSMDEVDTSKLGRRRWTPPSCCCDGDDIGSERRRGKRDPRARTSERRKNGQGGWVLEGIQGCRDDEQGRRQGKQATRTANHSARLPCKTRQKNEKEYGSILS